MKNLSNLDKIMKLQYLRTKSFVLMHHANRLYKLLKIRRKLNVTLANEICVLIVQLNGTKIRLVMRLRKNSMKAGLMS
jgi:hypothetical protein